MCRTKGVECWHAVACKQKMQPRPTPPAREEQKMQPRPTPPAGKRWESYADYLMRLDVPDALRAEHIRMRGAKQGPAFEKVVDTCTATARGRETLVCLETHYSPDAPTFDATWERVFRKLFGAADLEALAAKTRCSKKKLLRLLVDEARAPDLQLLAVKHVSAAPKIPRDAVPAAIAAARDIDRREHGGYFARLAAALGCANATSALRLS